MDFPQFMGKAIPTNLCVLATTNSSSFSSHSLQFSQLSSYQIRYFVECGYPGLNAFIQELLLLPKSDGINLDRIKKYAFRENDFIRENPTYKSKNRNYWDKMKFSSFGDISQIQTFQPIPKSNSVHKVLGLIGFKLHLNLTKPFLPNKNITENGSSIVDQSHPNKEPVFALTPDDVDSSSQAEEQSFCSEEDLSEQYSSFSSSSSNCNSENSSWHKPNNLESSNLLATPNISSNEANNNSQYLNENLHVNFPVCSD